MIKMEKEDLAGIIKEQLEYLDQRIKETDNDILYKQELLNLNKKFNKFTYECEEEIKKLAIQKGMLQNVKESFLETMNDYDVSFKDIEDYISEH